MNDDFQMVINGTPVAIAGPTVTFSELGDLAEPGHALDAKFAIKYRNAASEPHSGVLLEGESIEIKNRGTSCDVRLANRA
jgi:hypothetical protein